MILDSFLGGENKVCRLCCLELFRISLHGISNKKPHDKWYNHPEPQLKKSFTSSTDFHHEAEFRLEDMMLIKQKTM